MKPIMSVTGIVLVCWFVAASAQQQRTEITEKLAHKVFVLNGCLESSNAPATFRLTRATVVGQSPAPPPTRSADAAASPTQDVYELQPVAQLTDSGLKREELQSHVGKQVEVTIRPIEVPPPAPALPADTTVKPSQAPQRYTVTKIGRLAESCGEK
jgi:hypothetical protein